MVGVEFAHLAATDPIAASRMVELLSPEERHLLGVSLEDVTPTPPRERFRDFIKRVKPGYRFWRFNEAIIRQLQRVADGDLRFLIINIPPRYGKTLLVNLFAAYMANQYPDLWTGMASYGAELSFQSNAEALMFYLESGGHVTVTEEGEEVKLTGRKKSVRLWQTNGNGGVWAAGAGGPILGRGGHCLLLDDPTKNALEADSPVFRRKLVNWYQSVWTSREEPNCAYVIIQQRWHQLDLIGWLMEQEAVSPMGWHLILFDEVRTTNPPFEVPASCTLEPDWREEGDVLEPERYSKESVARKKQRRGTRFWWAMNLQRPRPQEGTVFKREWFPIVSAIPADVRFRLRYWDLAGSEKGGADDDPDYTAGVRASIDPSGVVWVEDLRCGQWGVPARNTHIVEAADDDAREFGREDPETGEFRPDTTAVPVWWESETGQGARERTASLRTLLIGYRIHNEGAVGQKELRWEPLQQWASAGNVRLVKGRWNSLFLDFMTSINAGVKDQKDDVADALSGAYARLAALYKASPSGTADIPLIEKQDPFGMTAPEDVIKPAPRERRNPFDPMA